MWFSKLFILFSMCAMLSAEVESSTHWMVTESGLIQPKLNSPFDMAHPYDLLAFLNQEKRWDDIFDLYNDLMKRQLVIDGLWLDVGEYTNIGTQIAQDEDCVKAGNINTIDWLAAILEDGSKKIPHDDFLFPSSYFNRHTDVPDCKRISSLKFSMFAFEHLESMMQRDNLTANPEYVLPEVIYPIMTLDQFSHWVTGILRYNSSSWLHYHLATLVWRNKGNAPKALECGRRAVLYAPRQYKDIALGSLGIILHRAGQTNDAIVVLTAAIDHDPTNYVSQFAIANAYTVLGEFNNSLKYYNDTLKLKPDMELAVKHRYGVLCHAKLAGRIKAIREKLNELRHELNEYTQKEEAWAKIQAEFLKTIKNGEDFEYRNVEKNYERMEEVTGINMREFKNHVDKNSLIKYFIEGPLYNDDRLGKQGISGIDTIYSLERLIRHVNKNPHMGDNNNNFLIEQPLDVKVTKDPDTKDTEPNTAKVPREGKTESRPTSEKKPASDKISEEVDISAFETGIFMFPPKMQINRNMEDFDKEADWPSNKFCKDVASRIPPRIDSVFPVFLPFENKGLRRATVLLGTGMFAQEILFVVTLPLVQDSTEKSRMESLLTEKIGVPLSEEYELPWHPPTCPQDKEVTALLQKKSKLQVIVMEELPSGFLRNKLLEYVSNGNVEAAMQKQDAEIGQRIYVAIKKKLGPKWLLFTLASLYWRVRGNMANALHCLLSAGRRVQQAYGDIVLVSLASVYLELGHIDEALLAAEEAFRISLYEPATNFVLAQVNMVKKHRNTHMFHLKQVVRVDPGFMKGLARNLLNGWGCVLKLSSMNDMDLETGNICSHLKPSMNVICEKNGENCHMTKIQCFTGVEKVAITRILARLTEEHEDNDDQDLSQHAANVAMDKAFFDYFIPHAPKDPADKLAHHANFDNMVKTIESVLKGCGHAGCEKVKPEDLDLKEEDCDYHHLQLGYWLHVVGFRQLLTESNIEFPSRIKSMPLAEKLIPDCRGTTDPENDFYLDRLSAVRTDGWDPVLSLMHQFSEMFDYFDFIGLGGKIAKYVETRPRSWTGALAAGWWCGAAGNGLCALRCLSSAHEYAPQRYKHLPLRLLSALLHMQSNKEEAKEVAYLALYMDPKNKVESFMVAVSHTALAEYEQAVWMYRFSLTLDQKFLPAKACLHATMCIMFFGDGKDKNE